MCLKLATPRTSGGLSKTLCIKVRKMKRRSLHRTYPTFNDTVRIPSMSVKYLQRGRRTKPRPKLLPGPKSPNSLFIIANAYAKKQQNSDYKGWESLFCLFHLFFKLQFPLYMSPSVSTGPCPKQLHVIDCDTGTCSTSSFRQ